MKSNTTIENTTNIKGEQAYGVRIHGKNAKKIVPSRLYFFDEKGICISCENSFKQQLPDFLMNISFVKKESFDFNYKMPYLYVLGRTGRKTRYGLAIPINLVGYANEAWRIKNDEKEVKLAIHSIDITGMGLTAENEYTVPSAITMLESKKQYYRLVESLLAIDIKDYKTQFVARQKKIEEEYLRYATINNALIGYTVEDFFLECPDVRQHI